jgi:hypothetical protein
VHFCYSVVVLLHTFFTRDLQNVNLFTTLLPCQVVTVVRAKHTGAQHHLPEAAGNVDPHDGLHHPHTLMTTGPASDPTLSSRSDVSRTYASTRSISFSHSYDSAQLEQPTPAFVAPHVQGISHSGSQRLVHSHSMRSSPSLRDTGNFSPPVTTAYPIVPALPIASTINATARSNNSSGRSNTPRTPSPLLPPSGSRRASFENLVMDDGLVGNIVDNIVDGILMTPRSMAIQPRGTNTPRALPPRSPAGGQGRNMISARSLSARTQSSRSNGEDSARALPLSSLPLPPYVQLRADEPTDNSRGPSNNLSREGSSRQVTLNGSSGGARTPHAFGSARTLSARSSGSNGGLQIQSYREGSIQSPRNGDEYRDDWNNTN